ncbi:MAG: DUF1592 domain-containing protein, partial [Planctomycetota bacterium]
MILGIASQTQGQELDELQKVFDQRIQPILEEKCADCHTGPEANAGVDFEQFTNVEQILDSDRFWNRVIREISNGRMPPEDSNPLSKPESKLLTSWIGNTLRSIDCNQVRPGQVTLRRLNRTEYRNTIRDILGVDFEGADSFPGDDVGYGFDNIGDVLSLPPILLEKYLDAAGTISLAAIRDVKQNAMNQSFAGSSFEPGSEKVWQSEGVSKFFTYSSIRKKIAFRLPGTYALVIKAYGDQAGDEPAKMSVTVNNQLIKTIDVKANRRKPKWYGTKLRVSEPGEQEIQIRFENDYYVPRKVGKADRNLYVEAILVRGPKVKPPSIDYLKFKSQDDTEAKDFIHQFLNRAFRGNVTQKTEDRFWSLYKDQLAGGFSFYEAIQTVVQTALVSPQFLFKLETPLANNETRSLNDLERATSLSYFLWSSAPDKQLIRLAKNGELTNKLTWKKEVNRLFNDDRANALVENFAAQWLNLRVLSEVQPDPKLFPAVDKLLLKDMRRETELVVQDIFKRNGSLLELLDCDFSFVNQRLAQHYQISGIEGDQFRKIRAE